MCFFDFVSERKLFDLLKKVQNRQYDDQRGTSLTAFKEMPDFLREPADDVFGENAISDKLMDERDILQQSEIEVCRRDLSDVDDDNVHFSLTPSRDFSPTCPFGDDYDSIMPSNDNAEHYFSQSARVPSPDFNDSRLMECSLRDIGMESPTRTGEAASNSKPRSNDGSSNGGGWSLVGTIANVQPSARGDSSAEKVDGFAVPTALPPLSLYRRISSSQSKERSVSQNSVPPLAASASCDDVAADLKNDELAASRQEKESSRSTPSPTTHDLFFVNGQCIVAKAVPFADDDVSHADDRYEVYGVV